MLPLLLLASCARVETYVEYVARSVSKLFMADADLANALANAGEPLLTMEQLAPLASANAQFLDDVESSFGDAKMPSAFAPIAVPLLVQFVRDWTAEGQRMRSLTYQPIVEALVPFLLGRGHGRGESGGAPRVLVPGSGTGRLVYMLAERLHGAHIIALDPDVHAQRAAAFMLAGGDLSSSSSGKAGEETSASSQPLLPATIYPSIHISSNWAKSAHRLAAVQVPDMPVEALRRVAASSNLTYAYASLEDGWDVDEWEPSQQADGRTRRRDFDAVGTCFVLDVLGDIRGSLRALHDMLRPTRGLWANLGPLAYPERTDGLSSPTAGGGGSMSMGRAVLTAAHQLALVRAAGFEIIEQRMVEGCEYNELPHRLERTVRTCLFFLARPGEMASVQVGTNGE